MIQDDLKVNYSVGRGHFKLDVNLIPKADSYISWNLRASLSSFLNQNHKQSLEHNKKESVI